MLNFVEQPCLTDQKTIQVVNRLKLRLEGTTADLPSLSGPGDCIKGPKNFYFQCENELVMFFVSDSKLKSHFEIINSLTFRQRVQVSC